jgi:diguanylate cyclase (GGDEF)-like protein
MTEEPTVPDERGKVLVVDDAPAILASLCELLSEDNEVFFATSGREAIDMAHAHSPDLILLDVMMPEMDGFEVCSRLKLSPRTTDIPVVFLTSKNEEVDYLDALKVGAVDYIQKPIDPDVVRARVKTLIQGKRKQENLKGLTVRDGLTGIANRRRFDGALRKAWASAEQNQTELSLILIDIDHFKLFNDDYGHIAGDACLCKIAEALSQALLRPVDLVARFRAEQFVCLLPGMDSSEALGVAERFQNAVSTLAIPHENSPTASTVTLSQGLVTMVPADDTLSDLLLVEADRQLYEAKRNGRNRIERSAESAGANSRISGASEQNTPLGLPTILLVDDDQHMRAILAGRLAFLPANVVVVKSAEEALNFFSRSKPEPMRLGWPHPGPQRHRTLNFIDQSKPQLVLSDVVMPGTDGFGLCKRVKGNTALRNIPFVMLTALGTNLRERSLQAGADDYLSKVEEDQVFRMRTRFLLELGILHAAGAAGSADVEDSTVYLCSSSTLIQQQLEVQLLPMGIRVDLVSDFKVLMQGLQLRMPDVLVLDLDQPEDSLQEFLTRLQNIPAFTDLPVLLLANKGEEARMLPLEGFITDRLIKPLEAEETCQRMKLLIRLARARRKAIVTHP